MQGEEIKSPDLKTPPPKINAFRSPTPEDPVKRQKTEEVPDEDGLWANSQREYFGRRGETWWNGDWGAGYWGKTSFWDYKQNRYVAAWADQTWSWDSSWDSSWQSGEPGKDDADDHERVRQVFAQRQPTQSAFETPAPSPAGENEDQEPFPEGEDLVKQLEAAMAAPDEEPAPAGAEKPVAAPAEAVKPVAAPAEAVKPVAVKQELDDSWRRDKYGKPLSPAALYMRFYRSLRSAQVESFLGLRKCLLSKVLRRSCRLKW